MSRSGGFKARANGEHFEALIEMACNRYKNAGVAFIEKTPEATKPIRPLKGGQFVTCFTKQAQPDFKGTIKPGRAVVFEAKHTASGRIEQNRVTDEQAKALTIHHELGAAVFVLVSFNLDTFYRVPWTVWRNMPEHFGKVSANAKDLEPYRVNILHFLDGLEAMA